RITAEAVRFVLEAEGGRDALLQMIALGEELEPQPVAEVPTRPGDDEVSTQLGDGEVSALEEAPKALVYRLIP
ncbi:MAG: hypothetical protein ACQETD_09685, partial [Pseudomonadota bacterium]